MRLRSIKAALLRAILNTGDFFDNVDSTYVDVTISVEAGDYGCPVTYPVQTTKQRIDRRIETEAEKAAKLLLDDLDSGRMRCPTPSALRTVCEAVLKEVE